MKKVRLILALSLLLGMFLSANSSHVYAITTYTACFALQNLEPAPATLSIVYYNQQGAVVATVSDTLEANQYKAYCPLDAVDTGFNGSVVVSSDRQLASIVNVMGDGYVNGASYTGQTSGALTVYVPLLMKDNFGYSTWFNVQNAGSNATNVSITYSDGVTASCSDLRPGAACTLNQQAEAHASGWVGAATIDGGGQPIAVTVVEVQHQSPAVIMFAYNGFAQGATNPMMPLINANNFGYWTGVQIMNTGSSETSVTVSYTPGAGQPGTACTETQTIAPGQSKTFAAVFTYPAGPGVTTDCTMGPTFIGSAQVTGNTANMPLTAIVNQLNPATNKGAAYAGFDLSVATSTVALPLIMDRNYGYWTGFSVMNVGTSAVDINCTFTGSSYTVSGTDVQPGAALVDTQINKIANGYTGGATCTATGTDPKIIGVVNELNTRPSHAANDAFLVYEGVNQ
ncbi:MAG: hypothetical protein ACUVS6_12350 [Anaerolineae bacterium]